MAEDETDQPDAAALAEQKKVGDWRLKMLLDAGFDIPAAEVLAARTDIDVHGVTKAVLRGCPHKTALEIFL